MKRSKDLVYSNLTSIFDNFIISFTERVPLPEKGGVFSIFSKGTPVAPSDPATYTVCLQSVAADLIAALHYRAKATSVEINMFDSISKNAGSEEKYLPQLTRALSRTISIETATAYMKLLKHLGLTIDNPAQAFTVPPLANLTASFSRKYVNSDGALKAYPVSTDYLQYRIKFLDSAISTINKIKSWSGDCKKYIRIINVAMNLRTGVSPLGLESFIELANDYRTQKPTSLSMIEFVSEADKAGLKSYISANKDEITRNSVNIYKAITDAISLVNPALVKVNSVSGAAVNSSSGDGMGGGYRRRATRKRRTNKRKTRRHH